jgi:hypothetical protein
MLTLRYLAVLADSVLFNQRQDPMGDGSPGRKFEKGKGRAHQNGDVLALDLGSAEEGTSGQNGGAFMQMQLVEQQVIYYLLLHGHLLNNTRRTRTSNPAHRPSSPLNRRLRSWAPYLLN